MLPIGIFDSGYGGLTILQAIRQLLPQYDYIYLGDNARAPYGTRSFDIIYQYTLQAVRKLFDLNCPLIILACNTASAKALRTIQQRDLPKLSEPHSSLVTLHSSLPRRVLGIIRPTVEALPSITRTQHIGILATPGTIQSQSYNLEIRKFLPNAHITGIPCPMWVPLVENNFHQSPGADFFVKQPIELLIKADPRIDTILLACTHYPLLLPKIQQYTPENIQIVAQGSYVAHSLEDYLQRHPDIQQQLSTQRSTTYLTTEKPLIFQQSAQRFLKQNNISAQHIDI